MVTNQIGIHVGTTLKIHVCVHTSAVPQHRGRGEGARGGGAAAPTRELELINPARTDRAYRPQRRSLSV